MYTIIQGKEYQLKSELFKNIEQLKIINPPLIKYAKKAFFANGIWQVVNSYGEIITPFNFAVYVDGKKINKQA